MRVLVPFLLSALAFLAAACGSVQQTVDQRLLDPGAPWVADPVELGRDAEWFEIEEGRGSMTGWFLRAPGGDGRTVVLFHGNRMNATTMHPWYSFLLDAGFHVCAFDYRGFGRSQGEPGLRGMVYDLPALMDWLRARPDVDRERIAFFGFGIGAAVALHEAARSGAAALVLENVPSLVELLDADGTMTSIRASVLEFGGIPENSEPVVTAKKVRSPSLWIAGAELPQRRLRAMLRAYVEAGGDKQLWVLPGTGDTPHALGTHDGEYQRNVVRFLQTALAGEPERVAVEWKKSNPGPDGTTWWEVALRRENGAGGAAGAGGAGAGAGAPWCVEVCALDAEANATFQGFVVDGSSRTVRMKLASEPGVIGAAVLRSAEPQPAGDFRRKATPLQIAMQWYTDHAAAIDELRNATEPDVGTATTFAKEVRAAEGMLPLLPSPDPQLTHAYPLLEAQLADVYLAMGLAFARGAQQEGEQRDEAHYWLQRAIAAIPAAPQRHWWPSAPPTFGLPDDLRPRAEAAIARLQ